MSWLTPSLPLLTEHDRFGNLPLGTSFFLPFQPAKFIKEEPTRANIYTRSGDRLPLGLAADLPVWRIVES